MAFEGFADIFESHYETGSGLSKNLELRLWTDASSAPFEEAQSLRTGLDSVGLTVSGSSGTIHVYDGYGIVTLDADITTPVYQPGGDPTGDPADIQWLELYDTSHNGTVAFAELGSPLTVAGGQEIKIKSGTEYRMGYPGSDDVPPAPGNLTATAPNDALADALATELDNGSTIDGLLYTFEELHVHLDTDDTKVDTNPIVLSLTSPSFDTTTPTPNGNVIRCRIDFNNLAEYQFDQSFSVNGITLELVDPDGEGAGSPGGVYLAYTDRSDGEGFGTQYEVNQFDIIV